VSVDAGPAITVPMNSHGVAAADFNNDGSVEIVVNNSHAPPSLLKNTAEQGNWILLKLVGTKTNHDAIGARVTVHADGHQQMQEVRSGGGYISQNDFRLHFGLGHARKMDLLEIRWPTGSTEKFDGVSANQIVTVKEGAGIVKH
jgi:enediyne biosynthesis protein E4